jgi:hypothetical protein
LANGIAGDGHGFLTTRQVTQQGGNPDNGHGTSSFRLSSPLPGVSVPFGNRKGCAIVK